MRHGGDLDEATRLYGEPPQGWLDLSTGINPKHFPIEDFSRLKAAMVRLPEPSRLAELLGAARSAYGVPDGVAIAAAPGTEALIRSLPDLLSGPVALLPTSYRSYREAWSGTGHLYPVDSLDAARESAERSVVIVNPNNPDGRLHSPAELRSLASGLGAPHVLVVDEAYADCDPPASVVPHLRPGDRVLVLRSLGKFYGLPGLRLGFAIGQEPLIQRMADRFGDWPASGPAIHIGAEALSDADWQRSMRHWLGNQAQALDAVLLRAGRRVTGGCRLFRAVETADAQALHKRLARQGIWTRIFEDWPGLMRFGLPPDGDGLTRLADAIARS